MPSQLNSPGPIHLSRWQGVFAFIGVGAAVVVAVIEVLRFLGYGAAAMPWPPEIV
jgi:hypothetical protein